MPLDNRKKKPTEEPELVEALKDLDVAPVVDPIPEPEPTPDPVDPIDLPDPVEDEPEVDPIPPTSDWKERYTNSSREALVLFSKNKKLTDTITEASGLVDATTEELVTYARENGAEYEELDDFSKNILKKTYINEKRFKKIEEVSSSSKALDQWVQKVDAFLDDSDVAQKYPEIVSDADGFKSFCLRSEAQGNDLNLLAGAFLWNTPKTKKASGSLLLDRGNGHHAPPKPKGLTADDLITIRRTDPKRYKELIKSGVASRISID